MPKTKTKQELVEIVKDEAAIMLADNPVPATFEGTRQLIEKAIVKGMNIGLALANEQFSEVVEHVQGISLPRLANQVDSSYPTHKIGDYPNEE